MHVWLAVGEGGGWSVALRKARASRLACMHADKTGMNTFRCRATATCEPICVRDVAADATRRVSDPPHIVHGIYLK